MTPRQLREQIEVIDRRLKDLVPWERKLIAARHQWLLDETDDAALAVSIIDKGLRSGTGRPARLDLPPLDAGWPGLWDTRGEIAQLEERRELLAEQLPSKAVRAERVREAEARAAEIRKRAEDLPALIASLKEPLQELSRIAIEVVEEVCRVREDNVTLDRIAAAGDIARPETPHVETPKVTVAAPLSTLLRAYFAGGQPCGLDANLVREIREKLGPEKQRPAST